MEPSRPDVRHQVDRFVDAVNRGNLQGVRDHIARDFFGYSPVDDEPDAATVFYELISDLKRALPDLQVAVRDLRADGEVMRGHVSFGGTHDRPLWGAPASGQVIEWTSDIAIRPLDDRFAISFENYQVPQVMGLMRRLGLVNPPEEMDRPPKYPASPPDVLLKLIFNGRAADMPCSHLDDIRVTEPSTRVCEKCRVEGDIWPALRMCLICGHVGCCDTSKNKHARQHYEETGHALMRSIRLDEGWIWCYPDNAFFSKRTLEKYR